MINKERPGQEPRAFRFLASVVRQCCCRIFGSQMAEASNQVPRRPAYGQEVPKFASTVVMSVKLTTPLASASPGPVPGA